jgi:hypothetical protein
MAGANDGSLISIDAQGGYILLEELYLGGRDGKLLGGRQRARFGTGGLVVGSSL